MLRGSWISDGSHSSVLKTADGIAESLDFLQEHGFNAVFPAVWNRGLTAFPSRVMERHGFSVQDPQYGGFDPLGAIVREGKQRGMALELNRKQRRRILLKSKRPRRCLRR